MYSFYPGPSQVWADVPRWVEDAYKTGILGQNHRSPAFRELYQAVDAEFRRVHKLPRNYHLFFTSSATECWEIIAQSVIENGVSLHLSQGAFADKWQVYTHRLTQNTLKIEFGIHDEIRLEQSDVNLAPKVIALTHTETSTGGQIPDYTLAKIRQNFPEAFIAVDSTSSMGGVELPWSEADIWFASAQKCLGLPAGLGVLICSDKVLDQSTETKYYNSLNFLAENGQKWQTTHTPNVLGIYLLLRSLKQSKEITIVQSELANEALKFYDLLERIGHTEPIVQNKHLRATTVIAARLYEPYLSKLKADATKAGVLLGNGYGELKNSSFRIANFPAMPAMVKLQLREFLTHWKPA
jgi:phosphoserine aminotransferase